MNENSSLFYWTAKEGLPLKHYILNGLHRHRATATSMKFRAKSVLNTRSHGLHACSVDSVPLLLLKEWNRVVFGGRESVMEVKGRGDGWRRGGRSCWAIANELASAAAGPCSQSLSLPSQSCSCSLIVAVAGSRASPIMQLKQRERQRV